MGYSDRDGHMTFFGRGDPIGLCEGLPLCADSPGVVTRGARGLEVVANGGEGLEEVSRRQSPYPKKWSARGGMV